MFNDFGTRNLLPEDFVINRMSPIDDNKKKKS